jgi:hypothetical protein
MHIHYTQTEITESTSRKKVCIGHKDESVNVVYRRSRCFIVGKVWNILVDGVDKLQSFSC